MGLGFFSQKSITLRNSLRVAGSFVMQKAGSFASLRYARLKGEKNAPYEVFSP